MREGWKLSVIRPNRFNKRRTSSISFQSSDYQLRLPIALSTVEKLHELGLLRSEYNLTHDYFLTEIGKTIKL